MFYRSSDFPLSFPYLFVAGLWLFLPLEFSDVCTFVIFQVPLKPGRSLMDWIRLTKSGKDLTGLKGRLIEVTEDELAKHNKKEDCWICIRGWLL